MSRHEIEQEKIEADEQARHDAGECDGLPCCAYCLADWEEQNREELDREGYYDSRSGSVHYCWRYFYLLRGLGVSTWPTTL